MPLQAHALRSSIEKCLSFRARTFESRNVLFLHPVLLFNTSAQLIERFPTAYGSCRCAEEKLSIPLEARDFRWASKNFLSLSFRAETFQSHELFALRPILLKLHI